METLSLSDGQGVEICDNVGKLLASQLDSDAIRNKVNRTVSDYLKSKNIDIAPAEVTRKLDWSVNVRLKK